jgi:flagellar hook-associated protein 2
MAIGVNGLMSGLDTGSIISQLMQVERRPILQLQRQEAGIQARISALGILKGGLAGLQAAVQALKNPEGFTQLKASSGNTEVLAASVSSAAFPGKYQVEVTALAQAQQVHSASFTASDERVGTGTITIQVGSGEAVAIAIDDAGSSLTGIASAINASEAGVTAGVVHDGSGNYYLTLAADKTGAANIINLTMEDADGDNTDAAGLSSLYPDPGKQDLTETRAAQNAQLLLNGVAVERPTNTIADLIDGVTITLRKGDPGKPFDLTIMRDSGMAATRLKEFIKQYNAVVDTLNNLQGYNPETKQAGTLQGDSLTRQVESQLRAFLHRQIGGAEQTVRSLSDLGVKTERDGKLSLDEKVLTKALENGREDVISFFTSTTEGSEGFAVQLHARLDGYLKGTTGLLAAKEKGLKVSISRLGQQVERIEMRLVKREENLRRQFEVLETLMANFQTTASVLDQQLQSISNLNAGISKMR